MKRFLLKAVAAAALISMPFTASAESAGAQFSFFDFNAPKTTTITGVRFTAIYGKSGDISGVDFALGYTEIDSLKGVAFPVIIGATKINGDMTGAAFGVFNWHGGNDVGANLSAVNITNNVKGFNGGVVNLSSGYTMVDLSVANISKSSHVQVGIFNMTDEIKGVQVGLLNCAKDGFLPCFPFVLW